MSWLVPQVKGGKNEAHKYAGLHSSQHPQKTTEQEKGEPPESGLVLMMLFDSDIHVCNEAL